MKHFLDPGNGLEQPRRHLALDREREPQPHGGQQGRGQQRVRRTRYWLLADPIRDPVEVVPNADRGQHLDPAAIAAVER
ncbi:MAG: hypothetical protein ACREQY_06870, partial [Candidatus Binatia bacterium]